MKVGFGCDHTAIDLKKELMEYMTEKGYECVDYGAYDASVRVDYPDQGQKVAEAIIAGEVEKGVLICGTGIGISLAANKVPGIRAAVCSEPYSAMMTAKHNASQIIAFGARVVGNETGKNDSGFLLQHYRSKAEDMQSVYRRLSRSRKNIINKKSKCRGSSYTGTAPIFF